MLKFKKYHDLQLLGREVVVEIYEFMKDHDPAVAGRELVINRLDKPD